MTLFAVLCNQGIHQECRDRAFHRPRACFAALRPLAIAPWTVPFWPSDSVASPAMKIVPPSEVTRSQVKRWLETIYRDVYHCSPDDPRLAQMVAGLPDPVLLD